MNRLRSIAARLRLTAAEEVVEEVPKGLAPPQTPKQVAQYLMRTLHGENPSIVYPKAAGTMPRTQAVMFDFGSEGDETGFAEARKLLYPKGWKLVVNVPSGPLASNAYYIMRHPKIAHQAFFSMDTKQGRPMCTVSGFI